MAETTVKVNILDLPTELIIDILAYLPLHALRSVSLTCQELRHHSLPKIWHSVELKDTCSPRRDPVNHLFHEHEAPEHDHDANRLPGIPLRFGPAALSSNNPRGAERRSVEHNDVVGVHRNMLDPREIADSRRRERDARYAKLDGCANVLGLDQHDDTPMILKLLILVRHPDIAAHVRVLSHRCHLPMPESSGEPMRMCVGGQTMSSDWRTIALLRKAIEYMTNVHTLRFTNPHWNIYRVMVCDFFNRERNCLRPIQKLWMENCSIAWDSWNTYCDFSTLESVRIRRSRLRNECPSNTNELDDDHSPPFFFARSGAPVAIRNGHGGLFFTPTSPVRRELECKPLLPEMVGDGGDVEEYININQCPPHFSLQSRCDVARRFDDIMYAALPEVQTYITNHLTDANVTLSREKHIQDLACIPEYDISGQRLISWIRSTSANLTHLSLDWFILRKRPNNFGISGHTVTFNPAERLLFADLSKLRIRNLKSFQLRNAVSDGTVLPSDIYLLTPTDVRTDNDFHGTVRVRVDFLSFLEAHPNIKALAWPMDAFLGEKPWLAGKPKTSEQITYAERTERMNRVLKNMGNMIETLRLDVFFVKSGAGEPQSDIKADNGVRSRECRRLFIQYVASRMRSVETLKMEGFIPRDEKREVLRALRACPLQRVIWIGRTFPLGNTWGEHAEVIETLEGEEFQTIFLDSVVREVVPDLETLESLPTSHAVARDSQTFVDGTAVSASLFKQAQQVWAVPPDEGEFVPTFGWQNGEPPLLYTLMHNFASTITELKFCGYNGSLIWERPQIHDHIITADISPLILHHLKHFHKLKTLVLSFYLLRHGKYTEDDVILTWLVCRDHLWKGKDEDDFDEIPNPENAPIIWDDIWSSNIGEVDREQLERTLEIYDQDEIVSKALRRVWIWEQYWSIKQTITPFPAFPDYELYQEQRRQEEQEHLLRGRLAGVLGPPGGLWGLNRLNFLPGDDDEMEVDHPPPPLLINPSTTTTRPRTAKIQKLKFNVDDDELPPPAAVFRAFDSSHYFQSWLTAPFLQAPDQPEQIRFFWDNIIEFLYILETRFSPRIMANSVHDQVRPFLSPQAVNSGLNVRASFCLGFSSSDVFDLDVLIREKGIKRWWGPRPEIDPGRWQQKAEERKYF